MKKILVVISIIAIAAIIAIIGFIFREKVYDNRIAELEEEYNRIQATAESVFLEINLTDLQYEKDKDFLDTMFDEIFTFYSIDDFNVAKTDAKSYGLPDGFINRFYDTTDYTSSLYGEAMLKVMCRYDASDLYLLDRQDNVGEYLAIVTLNNVEYNSTFKLALFISLADSGDMNERVQSMVYYMIQQEDPILYRWRG